MYVKESFGPKQAVTVAVTSTLTVVMIVAGTILMFVYLHGRIKALQEVDDISFDFDTDSVQVSDSGSFSSYFYYSGDYYSSYFEDSEIELDMHIQEQSPDNIKDDGDLLLLQDNILDPADDRPMNPE